MKFTALLQLTGKTSTGFEVPADVVEELGAGKRPKVVATINGYSWRTSIAPYNGSIWLGVSAENRAGAGVSAGEDLEVDVVVDDAPRVVDVPADLSAALADDAAAQTAWAKLSFSHQRQHVLAIEDAKSPATRQRRIDAALVKLRG